MLIEIKDYMKIAIDYDYINKLSLRSNVLFQSHLNSTIFLNKMFK